MALKQLKIGNESLGLEKEQTFDEFVKGKSLFDRFKWRAIKLLVSRIGYMPYALFQREDIKDDVVKKLLKHPKHLKAVIDWVEKTDQEALPLLKEAKVLFERIQKPKKRDSLLYRGFKVNSDQQALGLDKTLIKDMKPGDKFDAKADKLLSFTCFKEVTKAYGNVVVSVDYQKEDHRMFHITNEVMIAAFMIEDGVTEIDETFTSAQQFSYFESVLLPDGNPVTFTLLHK